VINDGGTAREGTVRVRIIDFDGAVKSTQDLPVTAAPLAATDVGAVAFPAGLSAVHFVRELSLGVRFLTPSARRCL